METEIIKLYDNEEYDYPLIEIKKGHYADFCEVLKEYQKDEEYNYDDFLILIRKEIWFIGKIEHDRRNFF